jgi:PleD family two-component response regulator
MIECGHLRVLLACGDPPVMVGIAAALREAGILVEEAVEFEAALKAVSQLRLPAVVCVDANRAEADAGRMAALRAAAGDRFPLVLIADTVKPWWREWLAEGIVEDVFEGRESAGHLRLRLEVVLRAFGRNQEVRALRAAATRKGPYDPAAGVHNRAGMLSLLFRETDRVQRMGTCLAMIACNFGNGGEAPSVSLSRRALAELVPRLNRLLRSYDLLGEVKPGILLVGLPGCDEENAVRLAERARLEFLSAMPLGSRAVPESACFGVAESHGRSPLVVVREAEQALQLARTAGPGSIRTASFGGPSGPASAHLTSEGLYRPFADASTKRAG